MRTTRIAITMARTVNLGNYNSARAEYTEEIELTEAEAGDRAGCQQHLMDRCEAGLRQALQHSRDSTS
jgi:hypothetical protein